MDVRQRRIKCFYRCLEGLKKADKLGNNVRFLTLTTPLCNGIGLDSDEKKELIQLQWRLLYKAIKKEFGEFPYFSVRTSEGNGVLHVVFYGNDCYIPFSWLMEKWVEINGTCFIWICDPYKRNKNCRDVSKYFMSQYVGGQVDFTYGFSQDWVYKGFLNDYRECKKACRIFDSGRKMYGNWVFDIDYEKLDLGISWLIDQKIINKDFKFYGLPYGIFKNKDLYDGNELLLGADSTSLHS